MVLISSVPLKVDGPTTYLLRSLLMLGRLIIVLFWTTAKTDWAYVGP
jgi:hypothetical protein